MLVGLKVMMQAMAPDRNWRWLQDACNRVQINAKPSKDKRARMRPTAEIFAAAIAELERLPADRPVAQAGPGLPRCPHARPFGGPAVAGEELRRLGAGASSRRPEGGWLITIPAEETKTRQPISFELPEPLVPWFERYLSEVRLLFPHAAESSRLWLGKEGVMRDSHAVYHRITRLTRRLFGTPINPHLLRDCAASSLAAVSADMARAAAPLLGHRHFSTTERYYIQADNLAASRRLGCDSRSNSRPPRRTSHEARRHLRPLFEREPARRLDRGSARGLPPLCRAARASGHGDLPGSRALRRQQQPTRL